ncbi:AAA family ATPase [Nocardiopsis oceani]
MPTFAHRGVAEALVLGGSASDVSEKLAEVGYLADSTTAHVCHLAQQLGKPILVEGPAGTGKTQLAKSLADAAGVRLVRLQCYEGLDEAKALYEWNYRRQLLRIQAVSTGDGIGESADSDVFGEEFLLTRPLLEAIRSPEPVVLLVDEVDRVEVETEALLLEVLSDFQVSIPELGTVTAHHVPLVVLTSNRTRDLSEALRRRCLYLHLDYPSAERERGIILSQVPGIEEGLAREIALAVRSLREIDLRKRPSVSETLDWARTLTRLGRGSVTEQDLEEGLSTLLKHQSDIEQVRGKLTESVSTAGAAERP